MGVLGTRLGRTVKGEPCPAKLADGTICGSTERYRRHKGSKKPGACAACARRLTAERRMRAKLGVTTEAA